MTTGFSLAKSGLQERELNLPTLFKFESTPGELDLSRDHACTSSFFDNESQPQRQDWLTGGARLNMNYSIIFTDISFYPETSILLQIIRIIHMTIWIISEFDGEGWAVCLFWLQGSKHDEAPTDKKSRLLKPPWGTFGPPLFSKGEGPTGSPR